MHDWTIVKVIAEWRTGEIEIELISPCGEIEILRAHKFKNLKIPRRSEWGESVSVNKISGPKNTGNGNVYFSMEIQSGDIIEFEAETITLPKLDS
ncbi:hypothetical protein NFI08_00210 [Halomonas sp. EF61]|uniref:hypothetical protein n=1 Tax=Halomonas sp. EF61 TaxID=2950869 RepID=UPI0032E02DD1